MVSKLNKQVWTALVCALFGMNNVTAESSEIMNHRIVVKANGLFPVKTKIEESFNKIANITEDAKKVKFDGFNWGIGGGVEYDYFINPYFGILTDVYFDYQNLASVKLPKVGKTGDKVEDKETLAFGKFGVKANLGAIVNFIEAGRIFDEEEECASSFMAGMYAKFGCDYNFGGDIDYKKFEATKSLDNAKKQAKLKTFQFAGELGFFAQLPLGLSLDFGFRNVFGDPLCSKEEKKADDNKSAEKSTSETEGEKMILGIPEITVGLGYDLGNLLY